MTATPQNPPPKARWVDYVLIIVFSLLLPLPLLDDCFHLDPTRPQTENRLLADCPPKPASLADLEAYPAAWEKFFSDHFGFRNCLILWHNKLNWRGFKEKSTPLVLVGTDGWLFYAENRMIDHYCGILSWNDNDLEGWRQLLEKRRAWLAARGIQYAVVVAPEKQSLYPEKLPAWLLRAAPPHHRTKLDQLVDYLHAHSDLKIIDLRTPLRQAKPVAPLYQMTDFHWNAYGAYIGYATLIQALGQTPVPLADYSFTNHPTVATDQAGNPRWVGGLAEMLGVTMPETDALFAVPGPSLPRCQTFLPVGEHIRDLASVKNPQLTQRAIVYQDSFARYWLPFLGNHFGETDFYWQYQFDPKEIERQKPAVVISEFLESKLNVTDPRQLSQADALP